VKHHDSLAVGTRSEKPAEDFSRSTSNSTNRTSIFSSKSIVALFASRPVFREMLHLRDIAVRPDRGLRGKNKFDQMIVKLTCAQRDTILAALRRWQSYPAAREADSIATGGGKHRPLDNAEIERICKRLCKIERQRDAAHLLRQSNNGTHGQKRLGTERPTSTERAINASSVIRQNLADAQ
jgi:hypothetical protein